MAEAAVPVAASVWIGGMYMGKENDLMLEYLRDNHRFADLFNGGLFFGKCVVEASQLEEASENYTEFRKAPANTAANTTTADTSSVTDGPSTVPRSRDIKKRLKSGEELRILAIEEQSHIDYTMPWRCMNYDTLEYSKQVRSIQRRNSMLGIFANSDEKLCCFRRQDRLTPVYTVCLYHGTDSWDGPRSLGEMMHFGSDERQALWNEQFSDYKMRLICVNERASPDRFTTGLKELFAIMPYRKDKRGMNQFLAEHKEYQQLDKETAYTISGIMGIKTFMENTEKFKEGEKYNMCQAIREMWEDGWNDGLSQGISQGINQGIEQGIAQGVERGVSLSASIFRAIRSGISANQEIAERCGCTEEEVENIRKAFDI